MRPLHTVESYPRTIDHAVLRLQHWLEVICYPEWCFSLGLDLVHRHALGNLNEREPVGEVNIKNALLSG